MSARSSHRAPHAFDASASLTRGGRRIRGLGRRSGKEDDAGDGRVQGSASPSSRMEIKEGTTNMQQFRRTVLGLQDAGE